MHCGAKNVKKNLGYPFTTRLLASSECIQAKDIVLEWDFRAKKSYNWAMYECIYDVIDRY